MRWQFSKKTDEKVGAHNPFVYLIGDVNLEDACSGIAVGFVMEAGIRTPGTEDAAEAFFAHKRKTKTRRRRLTPLQKRMESGGA